MAASEKKFERVYRWIISYIDENRFTENLKLPSEYAICMKFGVSRETVRAALEPLLREGIIYRVQGSGTYVNKESVLGWDGETGSKKVSMKIGLILQGQDIHANDQLICGVKQILREDMVDLRVFLTDNKFSNERRCLQTVMHQNFSGFIVDGVKASLLNPNLDCYKELHRRGIPIIFYNNYYKNLKFPRVIVNDVLCADKLITYLIQSGHRDIAGIFLCDNYQSVEKFQGTVEAMHRHGIDFQDDAFKLCLSCDLNDPAFHKTVEKFIRSILKYKAIVCCNYMIYQIVRTVLEKMYKQIPEEYSLVCFDYSGGKLENEKIICSIHQGEELGKQAAKRLLNMIQDKTCDDRGYSFVLRPKICIGESL